jgi:hypothetical protein
MAKEIASKRTEFEKCDDEDWDQFIVRTGKALDALTDKSGKVDPKRSLVGAVITFPRGDGSAFYEVVKDSPLTLAHIPYGDAWRIEAALVRGLRKDDVIRMLNRDRGMKAIFSRRAR